MRIDKAAIKREHPLPSIVGASIKLQRAGREWKACCPFHEDRTPSFTIYAGGERFECFGCGARGDVIDYVRKVHGVGFVQAVEMLGVGVMPSQPMREREEADQKGDRLSEALAIWNSAIEPARTPAEAYLRKRGLTLSLPQTVRFGRLRYGSRGPLHPCMIACVGMDRRIIGIQRTYLAADGIRKADVPKAKLSLGRVSGGAIRCAPAGPELVVTEGLEDGLSLQQELGLPVWVAAGASMLPTMRFPDCVRGVVIAADNDDAGRAAAGKAAEAFTARGLRVRIMRPAAGFKDWNEQLMGEGQ